MTAASTDADPITDEIHETSWSANLETPAHGKDRDLVLAHAREAIRKTAAGKHVNLVTHADHGHPSSYLHSALEAAFGADLEYEYVKQCGCGGHVTRVHVTE